MVQTKTFLIDGMSCGSCAISVEMLLAHQPGVKSAKVNFGDKSAVVELDDSEKFDFPAIEKIIKQMGYAIVEK